MTSQAISRALLIGILLVLPPPALWAPQEDLQGQALAVSEPAQPEQQADFAFGFGIGEERRYVLGPREAILRYEWAEWSISLVRIEGEGPAWRAVFWLGYKSATQDLAGATPWRAEGEVHVNRFGFPEYVDFTQQILGTGSLEGAPRTVYRREGDHYRKTVRFPTREREFEVPIARSGDLDLAEPAGIFLFVPNATGDNLFSNPGLLSLSLPHPLPDASWEQRIFFFTPTSTPHYEDAAWVAAERNRRETVARHFYISRVGPLERAEEVEIGSRTMWARHLDLQSGELRDVYVNSAGTVLRTDLDWRRERAARQRRWIRLLFPSEYSPLSPSDHFQSPVYAKLSLFLPGNT